MNIFIPDWIASWAAARSWHAGLTFVTAVAILLLCAMMPGRISPSQQTLLLLGLWGLGAAIVLLRVPPLGMLLMVPASMVVPFEVGTGTQSTIHAGIVVLVGSLGLWGLRLVVSKRHARVSPSRPQLALLLFVLATLLSFVAGQLPWFPLTPAPLRTQIGGLAVFLLSAGVYLLAAHQIPSTVWLQRLVWLFLALGVVYLLGTHLPRSVPLVRQMIQRNALGSQFYLWLVALLAGQALFNRRLPVGVRVVLGILLAILLRDSLTRLYEWKSGWIPSSVALATMLLLRWWQLIFVAVPVVVLRFPELMARMVAADEYSYSTRIDAWIILAQLIQANPILGFGPANYYWYTPLIPIRGYAVSFNSHNQYVDLVAQTGVLGLLCFLWFAWEVGRLGLRLLHQAPDGFPKAFVYSACGGLAGMLAAGMLGDWLLPFVYNVGLRGTRISLMGWLFLGGLEALNRIIQSKKPENMGR